MNKLKSLQKDYQAGKLTKEQYDAAVADLLSDEDITQEEHDDALEFDPEEGGGEKPIYTQSELNAVVVKKARALIKKAAKEAGLDVSEIKPQELLARVAELAVAGTGKAPETDEELKNLRKKAVAYDQLEPANKALVVENAVLKAAGKLNPVNPNQVVRALNADYAELLEYDEETGQLDPKSVSKAIKRIAEVEPNLFKEPEGGADPDEDLEGGTFSGKTPGGAGTGASKDKKAADKMATSKAAALKMMGITQEK